MRMIIGTSADDANQLIADVKAWQAQVNAAGINVSVNTPTPGATTATAGSSTVTTAIQAVNAAGQAATMAGQNAMMLAQQAQMNPTLSQQLASSMIMQPNGTPLSAMGLMQLAQAATTAGQAATTLGQQGAALAANSDASSWLAQANTATTNANNAANAANQAAQQLQMMMSSASMASPYGSAPVASYGGGGGGGFDSGGGSDGGYDDSNVDWGDDSGQGGGGEDDYATAQSMLDDVSAQDGGNYDDSWVDDTPLDDGSGFGDDFSDVMIGKQVHPDTVVGVALAESRGRKLYRHVLGAIDVDGLKQRLDGLDPTNHNLKMAWLDHGLALAQRATTAAQNIMAKAILPTNEFALHDSVIALDNRAKALSDKVVALPDDDNKSPIWEDVRSYFVDGSQLVNQLESVLDGSVKWSDVKEGVSQMASGVGKAAEAASSTIKWTSVALIGGTVVLGSGVLYALYKAITSDTGKAVAVTATRAALGR